MIIKQHYSSKMATTNLVAINFLVSFCPTDLVLYSKNYLASASQSLFKQLQISSSLAFLTIVLALVLFIYVLSHFLDTYCGGLVPCEQPNKRKFARQMIHSFMLQNKLALKPQCHFNIFFWNLRKGIFHAPEGTSVKLGLHI